MPFRRIWTSEEDQLLKYLRWSLIAEKLQNQYGITGRNQKQCRQRYHNHLDSSLNLGKLSEQEEKQLFCLHNQIGNKWAEIAKHFSGRTDASLKNIFHSKLRKAIRKINRYSKQKNNGTYRTFSLNLVRKIMEKSQQKVFTLVDKPILSSEFYQQIKNGLLEYAGSTVPFRMFEGWSEKKVCQHLITMLQNIQQFQQQPQLCQNDSVSEQSQYVPLKKKAYPQLRKIPFKVKQKQNTTLYENRETRESIESQKRNPFSQIYDNCFFTDQTNLLKKKSFETQNTQSQLFESKLKNYSFETNNIQTSQQNTDSMILDVLKQINFEWELRKTQPNNLCFEIEDLDALCMQTMSSVELFERIVEQDMIDPIIF